MLTFKAWIMIGSNKREPNFYVKVPASYSSRLRSSRVHFEIKYEVPQISTILNQS